MTQEEAEAKIAALQAQYDAVAKQCALEVPRRLEPGKMPDIGNPTEVLQDYYARKRAVMRPRQLELIAQQMANIRRQIAEKP